MLAMVALYFFVSSAERDMIADTSVSALILLVWLVRELVFDASSKAAMLALKLATMTLLNLIDPGVNAPFIWTCCFSPCFPSRLARALPRQFFFAPFFGWVADQFCSYYCSASSSALNYFYLYQQRSTPVVPNFPSLRLPLSAVATDISALVCFEFWTFAKRPDQTERGKAIVFLKLVTHPRIILFNSRNSREKFWVRGVERIQELGWSLSCHLGAGSWRG